MIKTIDITKGFDLVSLNRFSEIIQHGKVAKGSLNIDAIRNYIIQYGKDEITFEFHSILEDYVEKDLKMYSRRLKKIVEGTDYQITSDFKTSDDSKFGYYYAKISKECSE